MKLLDLFRKRKTKAEDPLLNEYVVEGMHCSHCEAAVCRSLEDVPGVESASASASRKLLTVRGTASEEVIRAAVEKTGYTFKGRK